MLINPSLPEHFFNLDNKLRPFDEIDKYWNKPFILTDEYQADVYADYLHRMDAVGIEGAMSELEFDEFVADCRRSWFEAFPSGVAYRVHCLDGGCHDRPTNWGSFGTLEEAQACCESGPRWRQADRRIKKN